MGKPINHCINDPQEYAPDKSDIARREEISSDFIEALKNGEHAAFEKLVRTITAQLVGFLNRLLHDQEDAEEVAQEVFCYLWEHRSSLESSKRIEGYIFAIAKSKALKMIRQRAIHEKYCAYQSQNQDDIDLRAPDKEIIAEEIRTILQNTIKKMPRMRREVYCLNREKGLNTDEISRELDISASTVYSHLYAAKKEIREALSVFFPENESVFTKNDRTTQ